MEMIMRSYPNDWVSDSIMCKRGVGGGSSGVTHQLTEEKQGTFHYTIGPYSDPVLHINPGDRVVVGDPRCLRGQDYQRDRRARRYPRDAVAEPAMRADHGRGGGEGGRLGGAHREDGAPRAAAARHLLHDQGVRRPDQHLLHGHAERAAAREGPQDRARRGARLLERSGHAALQAPHRHAELLTADRFDQLADTRQPRRQHGPAGYGARDGDLPAGPLPGRPAFHRRCPRLPRRRRGLRRCGRISDHHHHHGRSDQGLEHRVAAPGGRRLHHDHRQLPSAGGRHPHRLPRTGALDGGRVRLRQVGTPT